jgi:two-component system invasion response regulator UvrY
LAHTVSYHIFLVEDHPVMREAYVSVLGAEPDLELCGVAESAEEALGALNGETACDLVVTDLRLPGMNGIDLVARLHEARPGLPVLVVSAHEEELQARRAREAGAVGFLSKRTLPTTLVDTIRSVVAGDGAPA